ncbi:MAG: phage holin [Patescibacteria group bacterium]
MDQSRWKSPVLWTSLFALLYILLDNFGILKQIGIDAEEWNNIIDLVLVILAGFGIMNNPTSKTKF